MKKVFLVSVLLVMCAVGAFAQVGGNLGIVASVGIGSTLDQTLVGSRVGILGELSFPLDDDLLAGAQAQVSMFPVPGMLKTSLLMLDFGGRAFVGLRLGSIQVRPFAGYGWAYTGDSTTTLINGLIRMGAEAIIGHWGFEYSYAFGATAYRVPDGGGSTLEAEYSGPHHVVGISYRFGE
jgi:hypothetical protein